MSAETPSLERDILVVGAGPLGLELAANLQRLGADVGVLEAGQIGETMRAWPGSTRFYSAPERVALAGLPLHGPTQEGLLGEEYLAYLRSLVEWLALPVQTYERVTDVVREGEGFRLPTATLAGTRAWRCRRLVLATGGLSRPRRLGIPGEDLPHVDLLLPDPHRYFQRRLLVVGGKNSALEGALRAYRAGAEVTLSYRRERFRESEVKPFLSPELEMLMAKGEIRFLPRTVPERIEPGRVLLAPADETGPVAGPRTEVETDFVLLCVGYEADMSLFEAAGVRLTGPGRAPEADPETMETNVPGLYVVGTAAGGSQDRYDLFIATCHHHVEKACRALAGGEAVVGSGRWRHYPFALRDVQP
jgi:thioredoxin reductase (NADPH)